MSAFLTGLALGFLIGGPVGVIVMAIVAAGRDTDTSRAQGPMTPPEQSEEVAL